MSLQEHYDTKRQSSGGQGRLHALGVPLAAAYMRHVKPLRGFGR